jgi:hypothetical protein
LYFTIKNTVFYRSGKDGEFFNTAFFSEKYRLHLIYFLLHFSIRRRYMPQPIYTQAKSLRKGGGRNEDQKEGLHERACQTAGSEVLGNDAGC